MDALVRRDFKDSLADREGCKQRFAILCETFVDGLNEWHKGKAAGQPLTSTMGSLPTHSLLIHLGCSLGEIASALTDSCYTFGWHCLAHIFVPPIIALEEISTMMVNLDVRNYVKQLRISSALRKYVITTFLK